MSASLTSNITSVEKALKLLGASIIPSLEKGMVLGMEQFQGVMLKQQFTGRPGLRRVTGAAANSWAVHKKGTGLDFVVTLANAPRAWYILVHQHHNFDGHIRPVRAKSLRFKAGGQWVVTKHVYIPKRLRVPESFREIGPAIIKKRMVAEVKRVAGVK